MSDQDRFGRAYGLTWPAPLHRWGAVQLRVLFWFARHVAWVTRPLRRIAVIRALRWSILTHVPDGKGGRRRLHRPVLLFDAVFDVDLRRYIEVFAEALRWRFRGVWSSGLRYPGVLPSDGFYAWVEEHKAPAGHFWCAYPEATTKMVASALRVDTRIDAFDAEVAADDDDAFAARFDALVSSSANDL